MVSAGEYVRASAVTALQTAAAAVRAWVAKTSGTSQSTISTQADITGLSVTWTADVARIYKHSLTLCLTKTTAGTVSVYITTGANATVSVKTLSMANAETAAVHMEWTESGLSGSTTRKARIEAGTGTVEVTNNFSRNGILIVEDIGPV